jgi:hypothetical protein
LTRVCAGLNANGRVDDMPAPVIALVGGPAAHVAQNAQNAEDLAKSFTALGIGPRLKIIEHGVPTRIDPR